METTFEIEKTENGAYAIFQVIEFSDGSRKRMKGQICNTEEEAEAVIARMRCMANAIR